MNEARQQRLNQAMIDTEIYLREVDDRIWKDRQPGRAALACIDRAAKCMREAIKVGEDKPATLLMGVRCELLKALKCERLVR